jgi:hypothetical protein
LRAVAQTGADHRLTRRHREKMPLARHKLLSSILLDCFFPFEFSELLICLCDSIAGPLRGASSI